MTSECADGSSYFGSPEFLATTIHWLLCIEVPILVYGGYCIIFKTPEEMKSVKMPLLNLYFWTVLSDIVLNFTGIFYLLLPAMAGWGLGAVHAPGFLFYSMVTFLEGTYEHFSSDLPFFSSHSGFNHGNIREPLRLFSRSAKLVVQSSQASSVSRLPRGSVRIHPSLLLFAGSGVCEKTSPRGTPMSSALPLQRSSSLRAHPGSSSSSDVPGFCVYNFRIFDYNILHIDILEDVH